LLFTFVARKRLSAKFLCYGAQYGSRQRLTLRYFGLDNLIPAASIAFFSYQSSTTFRYISVFLSLVPLQTVWGTYNLQVSLAQACIVIVRNRQRLKRAQQMLSHFWPALSACTRQYLQHVIVKR
jgi:hypothetical protein